MAVTIKELAAQAGVSAMTVSRILSGRAGNKASAELCLRVRQLAAEAGYRPNQLAKAMRTGAVPLVALCLHRPTHTTTEFNDRINFYWYDLIENFSNELSNNHLEMLFVPYRSAEELAERLQKLVAANLLGGIICNILPEQNDAVCANVAACDRPFVMLGEPHKKSMPACSIDYSAADEHLLRLAAARQPGARVCDLRDYINADCPDNPERDTVFIIGTTGQYLKLRQQGVPEKMILHCAAHPLELRTGSGYYLEIPVRERCRTVCGMLLRQINGEAAEKISPTIIKLDQNNVKETHYE